MPIPVNLAPIKHIVVVMLENRSFDNVLGWLYQDSTPDHFIPAGTGLRYEGLYLAELDKYANPVKIGALTQWIRPIRGASTHVESGATYWDSPSIDPGEPLDNMTAQFFGPPPLSRNATMKGFAQDYADVCGASADIKQVQQVMETYTPDQLPVLNTLAKNYAVSDFWFASVPTQTNPNRAFMACGTSLNQVNNEGYWAYGNFDADTLWNRLHDKTSATWRIFWQETYVPIKDDNPIAPDKRGWTEKAFPRLRSIVGPDSFARISEFHRQARTGTLPAFSFIEPSWTLEGSRIGQTKGIQGDEMHPPGDVRPAEDFIAQVYTSLIAHPDTWKASLLLVTFDEHGGLFDHWPPPGATPPEPRLGSPFNRFGGRVPTIFVSPWIKPRTVVRAQNPGAVPERWFDHTSIPATVLAWQGVQPQDFGLGDRTKVAPTFDTVINAEAPRALEDAILGPRRTDLGTPVRLYDRFRLKCASGKYAGYFVGPAKWWVQTTKAWWYPTLIEAKYVSNAVPLSFTLGDLGGRDASGQPLVHGAFVYVQSLETKLRDLPSHLAVEDNYDAVQRTYCYYDKDLNRSPVFWTLKLADAGQAVVGQPVYFGDEVFLENRYIPSLEFWLPGKLIASAGELAVYLTVTGDPDYAKLDVGRWVIEPIGTSPSINLTSVPSHDVIVTS